MLMGLSNTAATLPGIIMPSLTNAIASSTDPNTLKLQWQVVFIVCSAVSIAGGVFYAIFAKGELQAFGNQVDEAVPLLQPSGPIND